MKTRVRSLFLRTQQEGKIEVEGEPRGPRNGRSEGRGKSRARVLGCLGVRARDGGEAHRYVRVDALPDQCCRSCLVEGLLVVSTPALTAHVEPHGLTFWAGPAITQPAEFLLCEDELTRGSFLEEKLSFFMQTWLNWRGGS